MNTRFLAQHILLRVAIDKAFAERALHAAFTRHVLSDADKAFVTQLVYGCLRHQEALDAALQKFAKKPLRTLPVPVVIALRLGAYQMLYLRTPSHAAVDESVRLVRSFGRLTGVTNAILRHISRMDVQDTSSTYTSLEDLASKTSQPLWLLEDVANQRGFEATCNFAIANNHPPTLALRTNTQRISTADLYVLLHNAGYACSTHPMFADYILVDKPGDIRGLPGFDAGYWIVQDMAASLIGALCLQDAYNNMVILDACSAPGGKACLLAQALQHQAAIYAVDKHPGKLRLIDANAKRLGLDNIYTYARDARNSLALQEMLQQAGHAYADLVLVDAPCSGMGTLRRHPELRRRDANITTLLEEQAAILRACATVVKPGGILVYAVCTVTRAEGIAQIEAFLNDHPHFTMDILPPNIAAFSSHTHMLQTWTDMFDFDSFFAVRLKSHLA